MKDQFTVPDIFFTSDTHFGHANILKYDTSRHIFSSVEHHDASMVMNWNKVVKANDIVYHLGDFAFKNPERHVQLLNGKIHLILGNHDGKDTRKLARWESIQDVLLLKNEKLFLSHYPHYSWPSAHHGICHLFGHVHEAFLHVPGVDWPNLNVGTHFHNFTPVHIDELKDRYNKS